MKLSLPAWRTWPLNLIGQWLALVGCTHPTPRDIAAGGANLLSAAIHVQHHLSEIDEAELEAADTSAAALLRCARQTGWRDDPDSIMRSIGMYRLN
jgi:hypothetical protein